MGLFSCSLFINQGFTFSISAILFKIRILILRFFAFTFYFFLDHIFSRSRSIPPPNIKEIKLFDHTFFKTNHTLSKTHGNPFIKTKITFYDRYHENLQKTLPLTLTHPPPLKLLYNLLLKINIYIFYYKKGYRVIKEWLLFFVYITNG